MYKRLLKIAASGLLVLAVALCGVQANAQSGPSGEHTGRRHRMSPDEELQRLDMALKLTDDQKGQIKPILEDRQQKMQSLRSDTSSFRTGQKEQDEEHLRRHQQQDSRRAQRRSEKDV